MMSGYGYRRYSNNSGYRNFRDGGFGRRRYVPPPTRADVLIEAGRMAAEYLASKGLLPASMLQAAAHRRRMLNYERSLSCVGSRSYYSDRTWRRARPYRRGYGVQYWGRENGTSGAWMERNRRCSDNVEGEYDIGSKASSPSMRNDPSPSNENVDESNKLVDDAKISNLEAGDEEKSDASDAMDRQLEGELVSKQASDLLSLCSPARLPTKPRSSLAQRSLNADHGPMNEASEVTSITDTTTGSVSDPLNQRNIPESQAHPISRASVNLMGECVDQERESSQSPPDFGPPEKAVEQMEEDSFAQSKCNETRHAIKRPRESSPSMALEDGENFEPQRVKNKGQYVERLSSDKEILVEAVDEEKAVDDALVPKVEAESDAKLEEAKQLPTPFKTCDLNFVEIPETTDIPDVAECRCSSVQPDQNHLEPGMS